VVELRQVTKRFNEFTAVREVSLRVDPGEFLTLLGPSGCGKTTLLRMISGFETPTEGAVLIDGSDVTRLPPYRRNVNQVFQSYALFPHLSVRENIAFGLRMQKTPRSERNRRVGEAIELVSLKSFESRRPNQLSGGQKQRVALARALVCRPRVLLLDEPLAALDAKLRRAMQIELKQLQARLGITFVFVTHDQEEALVMSDRIAVMNGGRIEQLGTAADVYHRPANSFVADFLGQANLMTAQVVSRIGADPAILVGGFRFNVPAAAIPLGVSAGSISIRPERIVISPTPSPGENTFPAIVRERIFRGAVYQLIVETDFAQRLAVLSTDAAWAEPPQPGDRVFGRIDPSDIVFFPERRGPEVDQLASR
jgi:spermidine/putrescine transport system ATP-binding protein